MGGKSVEQIKNESSRVAVLSGTINNGETIPLPDGYSEAQCKWLVSANERNIENETMSNRLRCVNCYTEGRTVRCYTKFATSKGGYFHYGNSANFIVIGVK